MLGADQIRLIAGPLEQRFVDAGRCLGACPGLGEQDFLVVAEHIAAAVPLEPLGDVVGEAVLVAGVAGAEQFVDVAHLLDGAIERCRVAVDVGDDADPH